MQGLSIPDDFPLDAFVGQEVSQLRIGVGQVELSFYRPLPHTDPSRWEPGGRIDIEAGFILQVPGSEEQIVRPPRFPKDSGVLTVQLQDLVSSIERLKGNELQLKFSSGVSLRLLTDPQGYESYHLHAAGDSVDVTKP